jgi:hypothetical protein
VERGRGQDDVERLGRQGPVLERGGDDLDLGEAGEVASGEGGKLRAELHRDDLAATLGQRHGGLPGPGADLQHPAARPDPGQLGQVVEERRRVARPGPVVQVGGLVEGRPQPLVIGWWHPNSVRCASPGRPAC